MEQALQEARADAAEAGAALKAAERQLAELETGALKARMEAGSLRARAQDLADRLAELRTATKARLAASFIFTHIPSIVAP